MLITSPFGNIVEKVIRDAEGRLVKAVFYVYESQGRVKARLLEATFIDEPCALGECTFRLSGCVLEEKQIEVKKTIGEAIPSPYQEILYFAGSKPRAPTK